jgi:two-component system, OmpR family, sensor histidine kinase MtrB
MRRLRLRPLGLRARLILSFALGALLLSVVLSTITWNLTRESLLRQRESSAVTRVFANALNLQRSLGGGQSLDMATLLSSLPTPDGAQLALNVNDVWDARNPVEFSRNDVPVDLLAAVESGRVARMRTQVRDTTYLVIGVPLPAAGAQYFEAVPLTDVRQTLDGLAISLLGASAVTTLAGGLVGFWASRRVLEPLRNVGLAAEAIAGGQLDTRLTSGDDHDLDPLVASFNDMVEALENRLERDTRFASEVSHELRSPLMTLAATLEVLENQRDELPERARTALELMRADMDRFRQLVEDLLEISRVDVGAVVLHLAPALVAELVVQAVALSSHGPVPVRFDDSLQETVVVVDKVRFSRTIDNLLANAANYADGATGVEVALVPGTEDAETGEVTPDTVVIAVEDAGAGVPEEEREVIFDRFSRGREGGNRGADSGTGLGLALVDEHIRLHGGRVWVEDRPDGQSGARFVIELPVAPDTSDASDDGAGYVDDDYGLETVDDETEGGWRPRDDAPAGKHGQLGDETGRVAVDPGATR